MICKLSTRIRVVPLSAAPEVHVGEGLCAERQQRHQWGRSVGRQWPESTNVSVRQAAAQQPSRETQAVELRERCSRRAAAQRPEHRRPLRRLDLVAAGRRTKSSRTIQPKVGWFHAKTSQINKLINDGAVPNAAG